MPRSEPWVVEAGASAPINRISATRRDSVLRQTREARRHPRTRRTRDRRSAKMPPRRGCLQAPLPEQCRGVGRQIVMLELVGGRSRERRFGAGVAPLDRDQYGPQIGELEPLERGLSQSWE